MALNQDDDAMYLYDVDSELFEGAHIFPLQYYELVRCSSIIRCGLTVVCIPFSGIGKGVQALLTTHTQFQAHPETGPVV